MSKKTLGLKPAPEVVAVPPALPVVETFTRAQLLEMLSRMPGANQDPTLDEPTGTIPAELVADKSLLPPPESRASSPVQPAPRLWGQHLNPSPLAAVAAPSARIIDPRTGQIPNQVMPAQGSSISPPPSRNFR